RVFSRSCADEACREPEFRFFSRAMKPLRLGRLLCWILCWLVLPWALSGAGQAAAPSSRLLDDWAADYLARKEPRGFGRRLTMAEALVVQKEFVRRLQPTLGRPVGYKVGLVTREAQEKYGVDAPLRGVLLEKMLLANGSEVPRDFGVRPILEADLVVVVKDKEINKAKSILDVAEHLKEVFA